MSHGAQLPGNRRILVVDDNAAIHADFRKILGHRSESEESLSLAEAELFGAVSGSGPTSPVFELQSASQGEEALNLAAAALQAHRPFALAFVDVRMPPGLDGIETTARLWRIDPDLQVVICTAYSDYSWSEMVARLGHSDRLVILKKPFDTMEVMQLASALTEKWALLQTTKQRLEKLENLVAKRTRHLEEANEKLSTEVARRVRREQSLQLQNDVARLLADSTGPSEQLIRQVLEMVCRRLQWDMGRLWLSDPHRNVLHCAGFLLLKNGQSVQPGDSSNPQEPGDAIWPVSLAPGCGLAGHAWKTGQPIWIRDGSPQMGELALHGEEAAGFVTGLALPLQIESETLGVLEFRGSDAVEDDGTMLKGLEPIASLIVHVLERRKLEEQLRHSQKMDAVGHLAGGIAHDFNNILTVISGYGQILKANGKLPVELAGAVNQVCMAADRAAMLTRQLLTFSRKQIMQAKPLDLNKVIAQTQGMLSRMIREDITLTFAPSDLPATVNADEGMLSQVLMNLACNARDAMPSGGELTITTDSLTIREEDTRSCAEARPGDFVCLKVKDSGCGISPETLHRIFEPFFTTKDVGRGTGLGLCTVYGIVKQHRGWIEVDTALGVGTTFRIYLPRHLETQAARSDELTHEPGGSKGETILLVEDEEPVRCLAGEILKRQGYQVLEAGSGVEALTMWDRHCSSINMLLTDIVMPDGLNGTELAARLRAQRGDLPVLLVSGYSPSDLHNRNSLNSTFFLPKPYSPQKLVDMVRTCLDAEPA